MRAVSQVLIASAAWLVASPGVSLAQTSDQGTKWLDALYDDVSEDLDAGRPLVVQVHVPLCENEIIPCGGDELGDGDNPSTNLYWATSGGFTGWFNRKGSRWKQVYKAAGDDDVLEIRVWKRRLRPGRRWKRRGVDSPLEVYVVAHAWRGNAIERAMNAYATDLYGDAPREIALDDTTVVRAGGAAHVVAFVGHNGWMDVDEFDWPTESDTARKKGTIAVACITEDYLAASIAAPTRVPLLMTTGLLFAGAHSFEGAVTAFAQARPLAAIRHSAIEAYATGQGKEAGKVSYVFTNPSSKKWKNQ